MITIILISDGNFCWRILKFPPFSLRHCIIFWQLLSSGELLARTIRVTHFFVLTKFTYFSCSSMFEKFFGSTRACHNYKIAGYIILHLCQYFSKIKTKGISNKIGPKQSNVILQSQTLKKTNISNQLVVDQTETAGTSWLRSTILLFVCNGI